MTVQPPSFPWLASSLASALIFLVPSPPARSAPRGSKPGVRATSPSRAAKPAARGAAAGRKQAAPAVRHPVARKLSAAARAPQADVLEKAALEIPDLETDDNVDTVMDALRRVKGVRYALVDLKTRLAVVDYDPALTALDRFLVACRGAGFEANEYRVEVRFPKPIKIKGG